MLTKQDSMSLFAGLEEGEKRDAVLQMLPAASSETRKEIASKAIDELGPSDRRELAGRLTEPGAKTRDLIWLIVVSTFSFILVAGVITMAIGLFSDMPAKPVVSAELILSMFMSAVGFMAGLFVPSPTNKGASS